MSPGATIKNPLENFLLSGCRTALATCQAMIIAITVVLPAPVANFSAMRIRSGLESLFEASSNDNIALPELVLGATSVSHIAVSAASI